MTCNLRQTFKNSSLCSRCVPGTLINCLCFDSHLIRVFRLQELQEILAEEQADHEFTEKKLNKAKKDLENAKDEMMKLKKV